MITNALFSFGLFYCNSLYLGISQSSLSRLKLVQNATSRLLTGPRKRDSITPVLASLYWLLVKYRTRFEVLLFVYKALQGLAPQYMSELLCPLSNPRPLRFWDQLLLTVPQVKQRGKGDCPFAVAAPSLLRLKLNTHMCSQAFECNSRFHDSFFTLLCFFKLIYWCMLMG